MVTKKYEPTMSEQYESPLVNAVLKRMKRDFENQEMEAIDELLRFCPRINLIQYLDEEEWGKWATREEEKEIYRFLNNFINDCKDT